MNRTNGENVLHETLIRITAAFILGAKVRQENM